MSHQTKWTSLAFHDAGTARAAISVAGPLLEIDEISQCVIFSMFNSPSSYFFFHSRFLSSRISKNIPTTKDVEPLLEIDGDIRSFEVFLSSRTPVLTARDVEMFLPCTVNLDPKLREIIAGPYIYTQVPLFTIIMVITLS